MRRIVPGRVDSWLLLVTLVGLFGCPLLLEDRFTTVALSDPDAGEPCIGVECVPPANDIGGGSGAGGGGTGGSSAGGNAGADNTGGTPMSGGDGGASGSAGTGGASGAGAGGSAQVDAGAACRRIEVSSTTYPSENNCIGVYGTSNVVVDAPTTLELSYDNGDPCFSGTIAPSGWGAVYELTFAGDDDGDSVWNADSAGVTGFEFAFRGNDQPSSVRVIYKDPSGVDNCHVIGEGTTSVPFSAAHPDCDNSGETVESDRLVEMILAFTNGGGSYDLDFCVQIRGLE